MICGDHNGVGISGIAPDVEVVPLKCFSSSGGGTVKILAPAIQAAVETYQCDIINMSWGLSSNSQTLYSALRSAYDAGVILVAAAGNVNNTYPQGTKIYPAAYNEVISVTAVNASLQILSSSQRNDQVSFCAPGGNVPFVDQSGNISSDSGISFAAPCVTAEIAILRQLAPNLDRDVMMELMEDRAMDLGDSGYDTAYGYGLLPLDNLIGQHWVRFDTTESDGGIYWSVFGWTLHHGGSRALLTALSDTGQMLGVRILATERDRGLLDHVFTEENATTYLIAFTDTAFIPLSPCERFSP
ncbi:MAG: S8 family serine peptidase [Oscillospiraceae bacterium]|nr:S8 family serine peptidase [Oscillospiraceae bacterium]